MSKHTPGPWRLNDPIHDHVLDDGYHSIDGGGGFPHNGQGFGITLSGYLADAQLIAAAPELLEALEEIYKAMIRYEGDVDGEPNSEHMQMMSRALTAIAKAKGEEV